MKLIEYMQQPNVKVADLADAAGCSITSLYNYANGREPRLCIALRIIRATKGKVKLRDLAKEQPPA